MKINKNLKKYIEDNILPSYKKNDLGHNIDHIKYVINRSLKFAEKVKDINYDMVYTIAAYHDIGHYIDAKNHEKVSAEMLQADENLRKFFTEDEIKIMSEAVYDHRASLEGEPRSIYGKIVSSADRNTLLDVPLKRTYAYRVKHNPNASLEDIIEESRQHIINKFGKKGYATEKMYFEDLDYKKFLEDIAILADNKDEFYKRYMIVNNIDKFEYYTRNVREDLKYYIVRYVFPRYKKNEKAHDVEHIKHVIIRSFELICENNLEVNHDIVFTTAAFHDIGHYIDSKNHEIISAEIMSKNKKLKKFFNDEEIKIIKEAIEDHRASAKDDPRSIYGRIVSSADRNNSVEACLRRTYTYGKKLDPDATDEELFLRAYDVLTKKFGENGYAKFYFKDRVYEEFLISLRELLKNKEEFVDTQRKYIEQLKKDDML